MKNAQWLLKNRPDGAVKATDFSPAIATTGEPEDGQLLAKTLYIGMEAGMRRWISDEKGYRLPLEPGDVMLGPSVVQVVKSRHSVFKEGDILLGGLFGWQEYSISACERTYLGNVRKVPEGFDPKFALSVFGSSGLAAYFGLLEAGELKTGDQVLISGAAGATGSVAVDIARAGGAGRVVGIAGGPEKCRWLVEKGGCDGAVDYKSGDMVAQLKREFPNGVDLFFDNVGGDVLDAGLLRMARWGRVILCGNTSSYDVKGGTGSLGPRNMFRVVAGSLTIKGLVFDYVDRADGALAELANWVRAGKIKPTFDVQEGFETIPSAFVRLFTGENIGKQVVKVADPA